MSVSKTEVVTVLIVLPVTRNLDYFPLIYMKISVNIELPYTVIEENQTKTDSEYTIYFNRSHKISSWIQKYFLIISVDRSPASVSKFNQRLAFRMSFTYNLTILGRIVTRDEYILYNHIQQRLKWLAPTDKYESVSKRERLMLCDWCEILMW